MEWLLRATRLRAVGELDCEGFRRVNGGWGSTLVETPLGVAGRPPWVRDGSAYSLRRVWAGSLRAARRAGT
jgi:hypothetical protein